jgi:hypothetical protein
MTYNHKDEQLYRVKRDVDDEFRNLHPTDRAKAFGELSEWASQRRDGREQINARDGVPDRSEATANGVPR